MPRSQGYYGPRDPGKGLVPQTNIVSASVTKPRNLDDRLDQKRGALVKEHLATHQQLFTSEQRDDNLLGASGRVYKEDPVLVRRQLEAAQRSVAKTRSPNVPPPMSEKTAEIRHKADPHRKNRFDDD